MVIFVIFGARAKPGKKQKLLFQYSLPSFFSSIFLSHQHTPLASSLLSVHCPEVSTVNHLKLRSFCSLHLSHPPSLLGRASSIVWIAGTYVQHKTYTRVIADMPWNNLPSSFAYSKARDVYTALAIARKAFNRTLFQKKNLKQNLKCAPANQLHFHTWWVAKISIWSSVTHSTSQYENSLYLIRNSRCL